ncbi:MAG TPA: tellurite resistance/C4-dicarboxylate transporter family protein [Pyrinomonadaceae bacterium]|nr:tellurite resistance/C4-dicarboxylate transporter family protein [Pyrinomonadaceae bacterium]
MSNPPHGRNFILQAAADLFPGYFALVMATGIISIACFLLEMQTTADVLLVINIVAYTLLWVLLLLRLFFFFKRVTDDLNNHVRGPGFFTVVAGTSVLGSQLLIVSGQFRIASLLWLLGLLLWAVIMYSFFTAMTVRENKPSIEGGLNGGWLLAVVATQSISVLGTLLVEHFADYREPTLFFTLCMFLLGSMLYIPLITLIFYRFTFVNITTTSLTPPYWINMGAVAITTLAGARLIIAAPQWTTLNEFMPFLKGFTLFFWAAGTWWIPLLLILGFWRHVYKKFPLKYDPQYWGMVFPLGMYTVCTIQLARAINFPLLLVIPRYFIYLALAGWLIASLGLFSSLLAKKSGATA